MNERTHYYVADGENTLYLGYRDHAEGKFYLFTRPPSSKTKQFGLRNWAEWKEYIETYELSIYRMFPLDEVSKELMYYVIPMSKVVHVPYEENEEEASNWWEEDYVA